MTYDFMMRLPLLAWLLFTGVTQTRVFLQFINTEPASFDFPHMIHIGMQVATISFLLLIGAAVIFRTVPTGKAKGLEPKISAFFGSFLVYAIPLFPRLSMSPSVEMGSTVLILFGTVGAIVALSRLGRSFSVMAETRQLVTSGPYRFVRHPLYLTEEIAVFGVFLQFASPWTALLLALQIAFQLRRMHNEEEVLTASFPEYGVYMQHTARLIPGIY